MLHVIRARAGDEVVLFEGSGGDTPGRVAHVGKREVRIQTTSFRVAPEPGVRLTLVQGWLLREKAAEVAELWCAWLPRARETRKLTQRR